MDALAIIVPLFTAILGYFFGKWNSERNRKWEVKDRQFKEAYAYLATYRKMVEIIEDYEKALMAIVDNHEELYKGLSEDQITQKVIKRIDDYVVAFGEMPKLLWDGMEMNTSIFILGDRKLSHLSGELHSLLTSELGNVLSFTKRLDKWDETDKFDDVKMQLERVSNFALNAHFLIGDMKFRLDKLAHKF